jgi:hypothetical protein
MLKSKLQSTLIGLSVTTATLNVAGFLLSNANLSKIEVDYLTPALVAFGFLQSMILMTNHLHVRARKEGSFGVLATSRTSSCPGPDWGSSSRGMHD